MEKTKKQLQTLSELLSERVFAKPVVMSEFLLSHPEGMEEHIEARFSRSFSKESDLEFTVLVNFKGMDPMFQRLARDVIEYYLRDSVRSVLNCFIHDYLSPCPAADQEVSGNE